MATQRNYVVGKMRRKPQQFVTEQHVEDRIFTDSDGVEYEIKWPRGRMLLSELRPHDPLGREEDEA